MSMGAVVHLIAYLEHHEPTTDGSFGICIASGTGNFISNDLYKSIPDQHRPSLDQDNQPEVEFMMGGSAKALGTTFVPILLRNAETGNLFRIKLHAYVLPRLRIPMFISHPRWIRESSYDAGRDNIHSCDFGTDGIVKLKEEPFRG